MTIVRKIVLGCGVVSHFTTYLGLPSSCLPACLNSTRQLSHLFTRVSHGLNQSSSPSDPSTSTSASSSSLPPLSPPPLLPPLPPLPPRSSTGGSTAECVSGQFFYNNNYSRSVGHQGQSVEGRWAPNYLMMVRDGRRLAIIRAKELNRWGG